MTNNDVVLSIGPTAVGRTRYSGWKTVRITRGIQRITGDFDLTLSNLSPDDSSFLVVRPGDYTDVFIGNDPVITGFTNVVNPIINIAQHEIRIVGRGKCQDLIDCSAEWEGGQISGSNALQVAQRLCEAYKIDVTSDGTDGPSIPLFSLILGETVFDVIERVARYGGFMAYELSDGSLRLSRAGTEQHSSGVAQGINVESAAFEWSDMMRYSSISAWQQTMQTAGDYGANIGPVATAKDETVIRNRKLYFQSEQIISGFELAKARVAWEQSRRSGESQVVRATVDSWRDSVGMLWQPNTLIPVSLPILKVPDGKMMLLVEVTYRQDESGTHADLVLMPPESFAPEPIILQNLSPDAVLGAGRG